MDGGAWRAGHGMLQAGTLEWVAMPSSRGSSRPRDPACIACVGRRVPYLPSCLRSPDVGVYDFDLSLALDDDKKPTPPPQKPAPGNDDFDLTDAIGGGGDDDRVSPKPPKPKPQPNPKQPGTSGNDNWDLNDALDGGGKGGGASPDSPNSKPQPDPKQPDSNEESPGVIPGIVGAIVVALGGAISSFIAYQKKKLCFKENAEEGEVNMENHRTKAEPAVQQTLLEK